MGTQVQELEKEAFELPVINSWRQGRPSREQIRFATDLCRTELPYTERVATINSFAMLDRWDISDLIDRLKDLRATRIKRLRRRSRRR